MANDFNRGIRVYLDTSDYGKGLEEMAAATKKYEKQLEELTEEAEELAKAGKNTGKEWEKLQRQIAQKEKQLKSATTAEGKYRQKLKETEKVLKNLSGATYNELLTARRQLRSEMQKTERSSQKYKATHEQLIRVDKELAKAQRDLNSQVGCQGTFWGKVAGGVNKYMATITTGIAAVTGISMTFRKLAEDVAHMDDVYSDVMKTTGMTREEVAALNEDLKKMDTRTSREELNRLASEAGKLGLSGRKDVLDFVDAGNQIRVALGEDLGEDAITSIGKMTGVFRASSRELQGLDLKGQMLAVGSAVNELGATSTASEPYLVNFAGRLGGVAKQAGISMSAILGFASSLDQDMQQVEMSATALQNFILKMMSEPAQFAKVAGMEVKAFTDLLERDANEALLTVLRSLNALGQEGGLQQLTPLFKDMGAEGSRAAGVLSALAGSIDQVEAAQRTASEAMTAGTSITDEYNVKNNNLQAELEKARNKFKETALELGERLSPALLKSTKGTTYLIKALVELPKWLKKNAGLLASLTVAVGAYTVAVKASVIADKLKVLWTDKIAASVKNLWKVLQNNPWGAVAAGLGVVVGLVADYFRKINAVTEAEKALQNVRDKTASQYDEQAAKIDLLNSRLHDEKLSIDERRAALEKLRELVPDYHAELTDEGMLINDNKRAIDDYLVSLEKQIRLQAAREELEELYRKKREQERVVGEKQKVQQDARQKFNTARIATYTNSSYRGLSTPGTQMFAQNAGYGKEHGVLVRANKELATAKEGLDEILIAITAIEDEIRDTPLTIAAPALGGEAVKLTKGRNSPTEPIDDRQKALAVLLQDTKLQTELATRAYEERLKAAGLYEREWTELSERERNIRLGIDEQYFDELKRLQTEAENVRFEEEKQRMGLAGRKREELTAEQQAALELLERQHTMNLQRIEESRQKQSVAGLKAYYEEQQQVEQQLIKANADTAEKAIEANHQAELLKLKEDRAARLLTQEQYAEKEKELARKTAEAKLKVAETEHAALLLLDDTPERRQEIEALIGRIRGLKMQLADMNVPESETKADDDFENKRRSALDKYGLTSPADRQRQELAALKQTYDAKLLSEEEYQRARINIALKYGREYTQAAQEIISAGSELVSSMEEAETAKVSAEYARREAALTEQYNNGIISQEEYNARKEQLDYEQRSAELEIQKKYADANFAMKVAEIGAATALGIMQAWSSSMALGPVAGPIAAGVMTGLLVGTSVAQIAAAKAERDRVKALTLEAPGGGEGGSTPTGSLVPVTDQAADGRYDVVGADDGRTYRNVPYRGVMRTGVVARPTLVGERGDEVVIDHPTLENLRMNAPYVIDTIMRNRVTAQRAEGKYDMTSPQSPLNSPQGGAFESTELQKTLELTNSLLSRLLHDPLMAYVVLSQLEAKQLLRDKSVKKGSLKQ